MTKLPPNFRSRPNKRTASPKSARGLYPYSRAEVQTEFFQTQLRALTEQGKEVGDTAAKPASEVINVPIK